MMSQYLAFLLIFSMLRSSSAVETSPGTQKGTCQNLHGVPGIPGSNGIPGNPGFPGPQGREGAKGQTGDKGSRGFMGPPGRTGVPGMKGIPGVPGRPGMSIKGRKGDKGDSFANQVPKTNWKQCGWKNINSNLDSGVITGCTFKKLQSDTSLRVSFQGNLAVRGKPAKCSRWYFKFNNSECSGPMTIEAVFYTNWSNDPNMLHHRSLEGYCENIPQGVVSVELWVGSCNSGHALGDAYTGWQSVSRIMIEEVPRSQS